MVEVLGKALLIIGVLLALVGAGLVLARHVPWLGRFPGDIVAHRGPITIYIPIVTMLLVSLALTLLINIMWRLFR